MRGSRLLPALASLSLLVLLAVTAWQWRDGPPVAADLLALLPAADAAGETALVARAEQRMQEPLERELIVLIGHPDRQRALALTAAIGDDWRASGAFDTVQWRFGTDLGALRQLLHDHRLVLLAATDRELLREHPATLIAERAAQLFDTFGGGGLLPPAQDWLGLGLRAQRALTPRGRVESDPTSGALVVPTPDLQWILLRARTGGGAAFNLDAPPLVAARIDRSRAAIEAAGGQLLAAGGVLHAAAGQATATRESSWIGGASAAGVLLMLLLAYRRVRVLAALLPVAVALLAGSAACVWQFGSINALTLVLGASLIGVAADFPQHYLSKSWGDPNWSSWAAVRRVLPGLTLSLATNLIGYLALALTPFPALRQVAVFSAAGLLGAYLCAVALLPACFAGMRLQPPSPPLQLALRLLAARQRLVDRIGNRGLLLGMLLFCAGGLWQLQSENDVRQWLGSDARLATDARAIATLTGEQPTSQFFLVRGADEDELLQRQLALTAQLDREVAAGRLQGYRSLSQLALPGAELATLRAALRSLPAHWSPLVAAGIPEAALRAELDYLVSQPPPTLAQVLALPVAAPWRPLWLGAVDDAATGVAGLIALQGRPAAGAMQAAASAVPGARYVDRLAELDRLFASTQWTAAGLKLAACVGMLLLLWRPFGLRGAAQVLAVPLLATAAAAATLGWLEQPLTLFSLFGLLLVTALGVDYAILMHESIGGAAVSLVGTALAAVTSWLSFGLLTLSGTPVIANFGLAVSAGLFFCCVLAPWAAPATASIDGKESHDRYS